MKLLAIFALLLLLGCSTTPEKAVIIRVLEVETNRGARAQYVAKKISDGAVITLTERFMGHIVGDTVYVRLYRDLNGAKFNRWFIEGGGQW